MSRTRLKRIEAQAKRLEPLDFGSHFCSKGDEHFISGFAEAEMSHDEAQKAANDIEALIKDVPWLLSRVAELEGFIDAVSSEAPLKDNLDEARAKLNAKILANPPKSPVWIMSDDEGDPVGIFKT